MTYFLMLLFVFWSLWLHTLKTTLPNNKYERLGAHVGRVAWACLGTFFFHNIW